MRTQPRGASRLGCWGLIIAIALLWGGGQGLYTGITNLSATEMSLTEYLGKRPNSKWLKLSNCTLDLPECAVRSSRLSESIDELFIPVREAGSIAEAKPIQILFATTDKTLINTLQQMRNLGNNKDAALKFLVEHRNEIYPTRTISGLVRFGIELKDSDRDKLASLNQRLASDFVILDDGKEPQLLLSIGMFAIGVVILFALLRGASSKPAAPAKPAEPTKAA